MAVFSKPGNTVYLTVGFWVDAQTGRVHYGSTDSALGKHGLHGNLRPGSAADRALRALLSSARTEQAG